MNSQVTDRGALFTLRFGDVTVTYLSGKDVDAQTPLFNMSVGEITVHNGGTAPVNVKYNAAQTFFTDHTFVFGKASEKTFRHPHSPTSEPTDFIDYMLPAGGQLPLSRQDYMDLFLRLGRPYFMDGSMCTTFEGVVTLAGKPHPLRFGPHCFEVDLDRDWDLEQKRYEKFFADRDAGS